MCEVRTCLVLGAACAGAMCASAMCCVQELGVLQETAQGLYCPDGDFFIDPWQPVPRALITHAHGDHARPGSAAYLCTPGTASLLRRRLGPDTSIQTVAYGERTRLGTVEVSFHPAGHVLGSAQISIYGSAGDLIAVVEYLRAD